MRQSIMNSAFGTNPMKIITSTNIIDDAVIQSSNAQSD